MNIGTLTIEMAANVARLSKDMDAARRTVERTFGSIEKDVARLKDMIGGLFAGVSATMFVGKLVAVQREFDALNSSLKTVTGSAAAAEREMAWLKQFAKETPFGLAQATQGFVKMQALGLNPTRAALTSFGNTASAMGKDLNQMIEAVADASTGEFERLKEFGIKAKKEGDNVSLTFQGVTTNIGNNAAEITAYLQAIGDNQFAGAMAERAKTLDGAIAGLGDTWDELFRTINAQPSGGIIYDSVVLATNAIEDMITILNALNGATAENAKQTGAMKVLQDGMAIVFETVAVLGVNLKYVLVQIGNEIGGIAAQIAAVLRGDFAQAGAIRDMMVADAEAARKEVDAVTARILNARKEALAAQGVQQAVAAGAPAVARALGGSSDAAKKFADQLENLLNKINGKDAGVDADFYKNLELLRDGYNKGKLSLEEYMALAEKYIKQQKFYQDQVKESAAAEEERRKAVERAAEEYAKVIQSAEDMVDQIQFEARALQMTNVEREVAIRLRDLERKGIKAGSAEYEEYARRIREAIVGKETVEASLEQQRKATKEWEKTWDQVGQSFTDALMQGGKSVKEYLISLFRTMVLRPMLQPIVGGIMGALGGGSGSGGSGGGSGLLGMVGNANSLYNLAAAPGTASMMLAGNFAMSGVGQALGLSTATAAGYAAPVYASAAEGGALLSAGTGTAAGGLTAAGSALTTAAAAAPYALAALAVADAVGAFGKGGGPQQGQYSQTTRDSFNVSHTSSGGAPLDSKALASAVLGQVDMLYSMAGRQKANVMIDQGYGFDPQGTSQDMKYRKINIDGRQLTSFDDRSVRGDSAGAAARLSHLTSKEIEAIAAAINDSKLNGIIETLKANFGDLAAAMEKYAVGQAKQQALLSLLQSDEEKQRDTTNSLFAAVGGAFNALNITMPDSVAGLHAFVAGLDLTTKSGADTLATLDALGPSLVSYIEAAKKVEADRRSWQEKLDVLNGTTTEKELERSRTLASTSDTATQALMRQVWATQDIADAAQVAAQAQQAAAARMLEIDTKRRDLSIQLLEAQGKTVEAEAEKRKDVLSALSDASLQDLQQQVWAALDAAKAQEAARQAAEAAQQAAQEQARAAQDLARQQEEARRAAEESARAQQQIRDEWQDKLDVLNGKTTEQEFERAKTLASVSDETTKSLMRQVFAMQDQAAAAKEAAAALDAAAASAAAAKEKAAAVAARQRELDIQLLDATGQTSAATSARRADALKALDNDQQRATQLQIWAAQDAAAANAKAAEAAQQAAQAAQQAAQEQARAQQQIRDEWQRTADSIFDTIRKLRGDVASPAQSYAAAQAQFSIATASARAGDQGAAGQLPQLAQSVVDLGKAIAVTRVDQQLLTARTIASLSATMEGMRQFGIEIPAFASGGYHAGGLRLVGENGPELEVTGSARIYNFEQTRDMLTGGGDMRGMRQELIALRRELAALRADNSAENRAIASATAKTAKTMERFDDGDALTVRVSA